MIGNSSDLSGLGETPKLTSSELHQMVLDADSYTLLTLMTHRSRLTTIKLKTVELAIEKAGKWVNDFDNMNRAFQILGWIAHGLPTTSANLARIFELVRSKGLYQIRGVLSSLAGNYNTDFDTLEGIIEKVADYMIDSGSKPRRPTAYVLDNDIAKPILETVILHPRYMRRRAELAGIDIDLPLDWLYELLDVQSTMTREEVERHLRTRLERINPNRFEVREYPVLYVQKPE